MPVIRFDHGTIKALFVLSLLLLKEHVKALLRLLESICIHVNPMMLCSIEKITRTPASSELKTLSQTKLVGMELLTSTAAKLDLDSALCFHKVPTYNLLQSPVEKVLEGS